VVIQMLVDIVSKNGNLLLNFPLRSDGTLDSREEAIIESLTQWTAMNGEAIFGTRARQVYGGGAGVVHSDKFNEGELRYSSEDIRFNTKGKDRYAIALWWPASGKLNIRSLSGANVHSARLLGAQDPLRFGGTGQGLQIEMPAQKPNEHAFAIRLEGAAG